MAGLSSWISPKLNSIHDKQMSGIRLTCICGLGNPGREYAATRHNIGARIVEQFAVSHGISLTDQFGGRSASVNLAGTKAILFIPGSYMNLSGQPFRRLLDFYKIPLADAIVIHDELELPYGVWQLRQAGGNAGHNGLRSIEKECGGNSFKRIKVGIGRPVHGDVSSWVLSRFSKDEEITMPLLLDSVIAALNAPNQLDSLINLKNQVFNEPRKRS